MMLLVFYVCHCHCHLNANVFILHQTSHARTHSHTHARILDDKVHQTMMVWLWIKKRATASNPSKKHASLELSLVPLCKANVVIPLNHILAALHRMDLLVGLEPILAEQQHA